MLHAVSDLHLSHTHTHTLFQTFIFYPLTAFSISRSVFNFHACRVYVKSRWTFLRDPLPAREINMFGISKQICPLGPE